MFEEAIKQYETLSPNQKKYFTAGQEIIVFNEKEKTLTKFVLSMMRTDLATDEEISLSINAINEESKLKITTSKEQKKEQDAAINAVKFGCKKLEASFRRWVSWLGHNNLQFMI